VFPIRAERPSRTVPWTTLGIVAANVAMFAWEVRLTTMLGPGALTAFIDTYAFVPARFFAQPFSSDQWRTVFTAMFMHAGWLHIGANMLFLWVFGAGLEDRLGHLRLLAFYLVAGVAATAAQALVAPTSVVPTLGASGAIAGVLAGYVILFPRRRITTLILIVIVIEVAALPAWLMIGVWLLTQVASGVGALGGASIASGGVAYFAHIGGFVAGAVMAAPLAVADRLRATRPGAGRAKARTP
jgi:membrane associated rhomboid family serine protease